jgi:hypothetical protein
MSRRAMTVAIAAVAVGAVLVSGCRQAVENPALTSWGEPDLTGVWRGEILGSSSGRDTFNLTALEGLYTADARARMKQMSANDDPTLQCTPPAFPRAAMLGQRLQIVQKPGFAFILTEAYPVARIIPTSGRPHTAEQYLFPSHLGDSTARWEGDTLVVDVISFNGEGWLASGQDKPTGASAGVWLTSAAMHVVERWRRIDAGTLEYRATVEDQEMLTKPWETPTITFKRQSTDRIEEALCRPEDGPETYLARLGS